VRVWWCDSHGSAKVGDRADVQKLIEIENVSAWGVEGRKGETLVIKTS